VLRTVARDPAGRITGYMHTNNGTAQPSLDQSFGYDNLNRLLTATIAGTSYGYSYDENGNRTGKTIGGTTYTNTIASTSNRLTQVQDVGGTAAVTHDAAGNITADGTNSYGYSDRGRMGSATTASGTVTYSYNGLEQRARKSSASGTSYYVYDEAGQLLGEYDATGKPLYETVHLGSMSVGVLKQTGGGVQQRHRRGDPERLRGPHRYGADGDETGQHAGVALGHG
jgi:YD repeat-containing protein